jgi:hypothetical protein
MERRGKDLGYYGDGGAISKVLIAWNGNSGSERPVSGVRTVSLGQPKTPDTFRRGKQSKDILAIPSSHSSVSGKPPLHGVGLASCVAVLPRNGGWPCAKRGDDQTNAFSNSLLVGPMENRIQILGNKSRSIAGVIAAQTFHIDMNLNPARLAAIP